MARCPKRPPSEPDVARGLDVAQSRMSPNTRCSRSLWSPQNLDSGWGKGMEPATLPRMACDTTTCPLSYGRIVSLGGRLFLQALWRRSQAQSRGCDLGPFPTRNRNSSAQNRANPPKPTPSHCYSCCSIAAAATTTTAATTSHL